MSFVPPAFVLADELARHNAAVVDIQGRPVTYTPSGGAALNLRAVIYAGAREEGVEPGAAIKSLFNASDFGSITPLNGDVVTISGVGYVVEDVGYFEGGGVDLRLRKKSV